MLAVALLVFGLLQAPGATPGHDDVRTTLERLETEWNIAHVRGDAAALDRLFSDDVVVIVPGMRVMTKADAVGMFTSGRMRFDKYDTSETTFRIVDDTAIVTGRLKRTRVIRGATVDDDWRFTKVRSPGRSLASNLISRVQHRVLTRPGDAQEQPTARKA